MSFGYQVLGFGAFPNRDTGYQVRHALVFDGTNDYLNKTFSTSGTNRKKFTFSCWFKLGALGATGTLFSCDDTSSDKEFMFWVQSDATIRIANYEGGTNVLNLITTPLFRDPTAWYNLVFEADTTPSTPNSSSIKLWINGVQVTSFSTETYPSQNFDFALGNSFDHEVGRYALSDNNLWNGSIAEMVFIDGTDYTSTNFGEFDAATGVWVPIDPSGLDFGTNGFHLKFDDPNNLGRDASVDSVTTTPSATFEAQYVSTANSTAYTFSSSDLGTAASNRSIVVGVGGGQATSGNRTCNSVVINGVTATKATEQLSFSGDNTSIFFAAVPSDATGDIVVTFSSGMVRAGIGVWSVTDLGNLLDTGGSKDVDGANLGLGIQMNGSKDSIAFYHVYDEGAASAFAFKGNGVTERYETLSGAFEGDGGQTGADATFSAGGRKTVTCVLSGDGNDGAMSGAVFGKANENQFEANSLGPDSVSVDSCTDDSTANVADQVKRGVSLNTFHPGTNTNLTFSEHNMTAVMSTAAYGTYYANTPIPSTGKYYAEVRVEGGTADISSTANWDGSVGILRKAGVGQSGAGGSYADDSPTGEKYHWLYGDANTTASGSKYHGGTTALKPNSSLEDHSILKIAVDMDNNKIWWGVDAGWMGNADGDNDGDPTEGETGSGTPSVGTAAFGPASKPIHGVGLDSDRITASSVTFSGTNLSSTNASNTIDNSSATQGLRVDGTGGVLTFDLGSAQTVKGVGMFLDNGGGNNQACTWSVAHSDNNTDFTDTNVDVEFLDNGEDSDDEQFMPIPGSNGSHRYWRLTVDSRNGTETATSGRIYGINFYTNVNRNMYFGGNAYTDPHRWIFDANEFVHTIPSGYSAVPGTVATKQGNFCTWSPLMSGPNAVTYKNGNRTVTTGAALATCGTMAVSTGKWIVEMQLGAFTSDLWLGIWSMETDLSGNGGNDSFEPWNTNQDPAADHGTWCIKPSTGYLIDGDGQGDPGTNASLENYYVGDTIAFCIDMDNATGSNKMWIAKNGMWQGSGNPDSGTGAQFTNLPDRATWMFGTRGSGATEVTMISNKTLFDYTYTNADNFLDMATYNFGAPTVTKPSDFFKTIIYQGTGAELSTGDTDVEALDFQPDFVWIKNRDTTDAHMLYDSVREATKDLHPSTADQESTTAQTLKSFDANGFTLGTDVQVNTNTENYVAWCLKAGGAPTTDNDNTSGAMDDGSVFKGGVVQSSYTPSGSPSNYPKKMSIASHGGFSIIEYTGTGANATVPHGLDRTPDHIMLKPLTQDHSWAGYHSAMGTGSGNDKVNRWDGTTIGDQLGTAWQNDPFQTEHVITFGNQTGQNQDTVPHIMYCWAKTPGLIGIGSYGGNGDDNGPNVIIDDGAFGFRPAFVYTKRIGHNSGDWWITDSTRTTFNTMSKAIYIDNQAEEDANDNRIDFTANGFKLRDDSARRNAGGTSGVNIYMYLAFAEEPFQGVTGVDIAQARAG